MSDEIEFTPEVDGANLEELKSIKILIVDDEPEVHKVTELVLDGALFNNKPVKLLFASSAAEAKNILNEHFDICLAFIDVVMETDHAGLDLVKDIRRSGNNLIRLVLRTGQPGIAPEREVIENYDIDGYLPKSDLTSDRLYSTARTSVRAYDALRELIYRKETLLMIHESVGSMHAFESLNLTLWNVLETALTIQPSKHGILALTTFSDEGDPNHFFLRSGEFQNEESAKKEALSLGTVQK